MQSELENATEKLSNMLESDDVIRWCKEDDQIDMINQTNQVLVLKYQPGTLGFKGWGVARVGNV